MRQYGPLPVRVCFGHVLNAPSREECQRLFQRVVAMNDENAVLKVRVRMPGQQPCLEERWYPLVN